MHGTGHFFIEFGWKSFLLALVFVMLADYVLEKFVKSEKIQKWLLYGVSLVFVGFMLYFGVFEKLK